MSRVRARRAGRQSTGRAREILDVAEAAFADHGFQGVSIDEIAQRVGVSKPVIYQYFGSKDGLLKACINRSLAELDAVIRDELAGVTEPRTALERGVHAYFEFIESRPTAWSILMLESLITASRSAAALADARRQQTELIAGVLGRYAPRAPGTALEAVAEIIIGGCERLALWRLRHPEVTPECAARYVTSFAWDGLAEPIMRYGPSRVALP